MSKIKVIDEPCGRGKTSWAIQYMNKNPDKSFIYCTPFLDEITRIRKSCNQPFTEPHNYNKSKLNDFNELLMKGKNIAVTHCTFANSDDKTIEFLKNGHYCLILDEVLDILVHYNTACNDKIKQADIKHLLDTHNITIDEYGKVSWIGEPYTDGKFATMYAVAKRGYLYYLDKTMLVWQFPPEIFKLFDKVYVLTYLFDGSLLKPYFEYHSIPYELVGINYTNNEYSVSEYHNDKADRVKYKELIEICDNPKLNDYKASSLCKAWFDRSGKDRQADINKLRLNVKNYFQNICKAKSDSIMWTCYNSHKDKIKGKGYTAIRRITKNEKENLNSKELKKLQEKLSCFVPCNARATNVYADRYILAYLVNIYANPYVKRYFENKKRSDNISITVNEDCYALSCLIQWVFRSRIRKRQSIKLYIPSNRMRELLMAWLDGRI